MWPSSHVKETPMYCMLIQLGLPQNTRVIDTLKQSHIDIHEPLLAINHRLCNHTIPPCLVKEVFFKLSTIWFCDGYMCAIYNTHHVGHATPILKIEHYNLYLITTNHVISFLKTKLITMSIFGSTNLTMDQPTANNSLQVKIFASCASS